MKKIILIAFTLQINMSINAQNIRTKIDEIFNEWNQGNHPGGVISILKNDDLFFSKAYGYANIKYNIKTTKETIFNIGSVSKQFTAMAIVLLHLEGKLSIDDDIRNYLPELYDFENTITIRHLLHHTSGFRSTPELFGLAGWKDGDAITTDDDYRYFCKQNSLNFLPGSQFMYTNSGYILLAKIVENVTHQKFNIWMKTNIFIPLGMNATFVDETNSNSIPEIATPYHQVGEKQFIVGENMNLDIGASNVYTTVSDLTKWMTNFSNPIESFKAAFNLLQITDTLNNGASNNYAFGVVKDDFYGNKRIQHTGAVPGFLAYAMYYPEENITLILLSNFTSYGVNEKYNKLSKLFLKDKTLKAKKQTKHESIPLDIKFAQTIVGDFWNTAENYARRVYLEQDTLWYSRDNGIKSPLIQIDTNQFMIGNISAFVTVQFEVGSKKKMIIKDGDQPIKQLEDYDNTPLTQVKKQEYTGTYYSTELETTYKLTLINDQLTGYHSRHGEFPIAILKEDITNWSDMAIVKYKRNLKNEVIGFYLNMNRVKNVWFEKQ